MNKRQGNLLRLFSRAQTGMSQPYLRHSIVSKKKDIRILDSTSGKTFKNEGTLTCDLRLVHIRIPLRSVCLRSFTLAVQIARPSRPGSRQSPCRYCPRSRRAFRPVPFFNKATSRQYESACQHQDNFEQRSGAAHQYPRVQLRVGVVCSPTRAQGRA